MLILALIAAAAAPGDSKTMGGVDAWPWMTILEVGSPAQSPYYLRVAAGDLNGDGLADEAFLKLTCDGGVLKQAHYTIKSPRDAASGQASGKRTHNPVKFIKEWGAATPQLMAVKPTYNIKEAKGARVTSDGGGWTALKLANADGLCSATEVAAKIVTKTSSNIQNN